MPDPKTTLMTDEERAKARRSFVEDFALSVDVFRPDYCGYWMRSVCLDHGRVMRWLAIEHDVYDHIIATEIANGEWKRSFPAGYHILDRSVAEKAYSFGERKWGEDWMNGPHGDATGYDLVMQLALLGEVKYG